MQIRPSHLGLAILCAGLLLIAACSDDDDPTGPGPIHNLGPDYPFAATPDDVLANMVTAFAMGDTSGLVDLLHPTYQFLFRSQDLGEYHLPTNYLTRAEELVIASNMFSGEAVSSYSGAVAPQLGSINFADYVPVDPGWTVAGSESPYPGALQRRYAYQINLVVPGNQDFVFGGEVDFFVTSRDSIESNGSMRPYHQLIGQNNLVEIDEPKQSRLTWTVFRLLYLTNEKPTANLSVQWPNETPDLVHLDATASDQDSGLHASAYRWRFEAETSWSSWGSESSITHIYDTAGPKTAEVQVRDRWLGTGGGERGLVIERIFPDTPDKAVKLLQESYASRDLAVYAEGLHPAYTFVFSSFDVDSGAFPTDPLDRATELDISAHMFSGEPYDGGQGWIEPAIDEISFDRLDRITTWDDQISHPIFSAGSSRALFDVDFTAIRPTAEGVPTYIQVHGLQGFWTTSNDSLLTDGTERPYWQLVGQTDLTSPEIILSEGATWGTLKDLYR